MLAKTLNRFRVEFDPEAVSYEQLLAVFWQSHRPHSQSYGQQYKNALWFHDNGQRKAAERTRNELRADSGQTVYTEILEARTFYPAEDYHQKYYVRKKPGVMRELLAYYQDEAGFIGSTVVARMNSYVAGYGTLDSLNAELSSYGLTPEGEALLTKLVESREGIPLLCGGG